MVERAGDSVMIPFLDSTILYFFTHAQVRQHLHQRLGRHREDRGPGPGHHAAQPHSAAVGAG